MSRLHPIIKESSTDLAAAAERAEREARRSVRSRMTGPKKQGGSDYWKVGTEKAPLLPHRIHSPFLYEKYNVRDVRLETQWNTASIQDYMVRITIEDDSGRKHSFVCERDELIGFLKTE